MARTPETRLIYSTGRPPEKAAAEPPAKTRTDAIRLRLDRRASGRVVTLITGLPGTPAEVAALARALKRDCGAGGTVKNGALELQGDHRDRVEATLRERGFRFKRAGG